MAKNMKGRSREPDRDVVPKSILVVVCISSPINFINFLACFTKKIEGLGAAGAQHTGKPAIASAIHNINYLGNSWIPTRYLSYTSLLDLIVS